MWDKDLPSLNSQYHGCSWPGDARSQGINNHDIDQVEPGQLGPHTLRVKSTCRSGKRLVLLPGFAIKAEVTLVC